MEEVLARFANSTGPSHTYKRQEEEIKIPKGTHKTELYKVYVCNREEDMISKGVRIRSQILKRGVTRALGSL